MMNKNFDILVQYVKKMIICNLRRIMVEFRTIVSIINAAT